MEFKSLLRRIIITHRLLTILIQDIIIIPLRTVLATRTDHHRRTRLLGHTNNPMASIPWDRTTTNKEERIHPRTLPTDMDTRNRITRKVEVMDSSPTITSLDRWDILSRVMEIIKEALEIIIIILVTKEAMEEVTVDNSR